MTTLEKKFVQIFERKNWIIEEVQRQADAYTEDLASRLLIDGITPPPSLLNQRFNSRSSDPHELKKEEIISKLLLQRPRDSVRYSTGGHSLYDKPVVARENGQLSNEMCMETNTGLNVTNEPSKPNNDIGCSLTRVAEIDNSVNSPQNETDARISSILAAPDSSLARIQRSRSRQKALELRNSGKTTAKSCLSKEDRTRISFTGDTISQNDCHQVTQDSEPDKCNDHSKTNDKEESGGKSSQQSDQADGVMEGVNLADISLGSYGAKKSVTCKTHDTQRQSKLYSGRVTRSRGSSQQTNGINKSSELSTSVSCNSKEGRGALSYSLGDLKLGVDASNKVQDADADAVVAICSSKEVVISSNIAASRVTKSKSGSVKECPPEQEKAEIVVGNGPIDHVPVAVDSGKKLDPVVTMCTDSDGLALKQSSECCMLVKPKQLNFDEPDGCDPNGISRKRKLDGLLGEECEYPSTSEQHLPMEGDVSRQWKSARKEDFDVEKMNENPMVEDGLDMGCDSSMDDKSSEQQLLMENVLVSKAEGTHSHEEFDEITNITNPMVDDVEHSSKVSPHDVAAILSGVDESAVLHSKPSFTSCLSKQGEMDSEACLDAEVRPSLAKELEHMTNSNLSTLKLNTWPRNPQRNVDNQSNHRFSDSHIPNTDAIIYCDLFEEASHDDSYLLSKSKKETTVAEVAVDDATLNQSGPNILNSDKSEDVAVAVTDEMMPVYEGFTINDELESAIDFDTLDTMPSSTIKKASIIEQICKSASTHTPFSQFSATFQQHQDQVQELYKFMPNELIEDVSKHISETDCDLTEPDYTFPNQQTFDSVQFSGTPYNWQSKSYYSSPVGKFWDRSASSSGSSENRLSSNPELTCFPIEEDPDTNEESDTDQIQENVIMKEAANEEKVPEVVTDEVAIPNQLAEREPPPTGPMKYRERCSSNSVNVQVNVPRTQDKVKYKSKFHPGSIRSSKDENRTPSVSTRTSTRRNASFQTQNSKTMRSGIKRPSHKDSKLTNIVSNITSFVSIVQQKQAAAVAPVKRDIKVKALEAAEAAKRREQEKENERKMKKEALKIERARVEKENAREMELNKKRKQEEMKKKEADVAARKKQREEDERKQVAKKRKIAEARKDQKVQHEKTRGGKNAVIAGNKKGSENVRPNKNGDERNDKSLLPDAIHQVTSVTAQKETSVVEKSPGQAGSMGLTGQEPSYDISPYQCSDDEDEDEDDDLPNKKFVPSWASKKAVGMVLPLQHEVDPETIFPVGSFCNMDEVLLPRRLQTQ
ncbi:hypothetical protein LXL04_016150 [Taraxacum kok-saghyz]